MPTNKNGKAYKNNVALWLYFFCLGFSTAEIGVSITIGFLGGFVIGAFAAFLILNFIFAEMKKVD